MARLLGLELRPASAGVKPRSFRIVVDGRTCRPVQAATGLKPGVTRSMQLAEFDRMALDLSDVRFGDEWSLRSAGMRACVQF